MLNLSSITLSSDSAPAYVHAVLHRHLTITLGLLESILKEWMCYAHIVFGKMTKWKMQSFTWRNIWLINDPLISKYNIVNLIDRSVRVLLFAIGKIYNQQHFFLFVSFMTSLLSTTFSSFLFYCFWLEFTMLSPFYVLVLTLLSAFF